MSTDNITLLRDTAIEILERFAFLLGDPAESSSYDVTPLPEKLWVITLIFRGPRTGALRLATVPELARQVAANLYGTELDEVTDTQAGDALKELLNVITGDYLHKLEGNEPIFDLAAPQLVEWERAEFARHNAGYTGATLNVEGQILWLGFGN